MCDEAIKLVKQSKTVDRTGDTIITETERTVFAKLQDIGMREFYQAQANGFKPVIKFILPDFLEYQNEQIIKYQPFGGVEETFNVVRTYRNGNELEITCDRGVISDANA